MRTAVCDSGPFTNLWQIHQWKSFGTFGQIYVSKQVWLEIHEHVPFEQFASIAGATPLLYEVDSSTIIHYRDHVPAAETLQVADLSTLALALQLKPDFVLTDDLALRRVLEQQAQIPMGSIGILSRNKVPAGTFPCQTRVFNPAFYWSPARHSAIMKPPHRTRVHGMVLRS